MQTLFTGPGAPPPSPGAAGSPIKDTTTAAFRADVLDASMQVPVIVDFWAPWCGPCKQLGPVLEKAVLAARGAVRLVKLNIDEHPEIPQQLRVQSIPAVFAFFQGRPVDGFVGAVPESQVKAFVQRLAQQAGGPPDDPVADALAAADAALKDGDPAGAAEIYAQVLAHDSTSAAAFGGLARCYVALNDLVQARELLDSAGDELRRSPEFAAALAALDMAEAGAGAGDLRDLQARIEGDPDDHEARLELAVALFAANRRGDAVDQLLEIVRRDREWNEQAARKQLLKMFEAMGPADPLTLQARRRLSSLLFS